MSRSDESCHPALIYSLPPVTNNIPFNPWYEDVRALASLWRYLEDQGETPDDPAYFIEKAVKWTEEYDRMISEGWPS